MEEDTSELKLALQSAIFDNQNISVGKNDQKGLSKRGGESVQQEEHKLQSKSDQKSLLRVKESARSRYESAMDLK